MAPPLTHLAVAFALAVVAPCQPADAGSSVLDRAPGAADMAPLYQQDMLWLDPTGHTWAMRDFGKNAAVWRTLEPTARLIDEIGGTGPIAAYGMTRLTALYGGPAVAVVNSVTKATRDIGFLPDGSLDESALAAFCSGAECRVGRWYDQSGHRNDATQPTPAARPVIRLAHRTGRPLSIVWDYEATSGGPMRNLVLPGGMTIDSGDMTVLWTGRFHNASMVSPLIELGTDANAFNFGYWDAHGDFYLGTTNHLSELPGHATLTPSVGMISSSPQDGVVVGYRNQVRAQGKLPSESHSGGLIGGTTVYKAGGMMELSSLTLYPRGLTSLERFRSVQALGENFSIAQQQQDAYVADGDSLTQGIASPYSQSYPWHMEQRLPRSLVLYDTGWAAKTLGGDGGLVSRFADYTAKLLNPAARRNVISLFAGTNDLQNGVDDKELVQLIQRYAMAARKTGFRIAVATIIPRATFSAKNEAYRLAANATLRARWKEFADALVDLAADPVFADPKVVLDTTIYAEDGIHLTDFGYQALASAFAPVVTGLLE